ncbi:MAG: hypothetical protein NSGCLCUN01_02722 [uncultured Clostridium sp.]
MKEWNYKKNMKVEESEIGEYEIEKHTLKK